MTLNSEIRNTIQALRDTLPSELSALIEQGAGEISALDISGTALKEGDRIPDISLNDYHGNSKSLTDFLANGPLIITFYRGVWCPYCNLQLSEYNRRLADFRALGAELVAISPQLPDAERLFRASDAPEQAKQSIADELQFDVLHDPGNRAAREFGLVFDVPSAHLKLFELLRVDLESINADASFTVPDPATYVVSENARIHWRFVPNNYRKRAEADDIIRALVHA